MSDVKHVWIVRYTDGSIAEIFASAEGANAWRADAKHSYLPTSIHIWKVKP